ncbi:MAG: cation:proton antiporter [Campylobacterota bacterium]|nr:cation:proton antiporter [Campylobacterota bacterium]
MLTIIVTTLLISLILNVILKKFHLPTIIGYIFTGTIVAYGFHLHDAVHNHELKEIAEFGVVFLMFTIGLEFSLEHLKKMRYEVFVAGTLQILITACIVYTIAHYLLGIEQTVSFILSLAISLSSTAIVLKTFNETGEINRRYGQRSLGILIMQDIAVIPILLIIGFLSSDTQDISDVLFNMLISALFLLVLLWISGKYLLEPFFTQIIKTKSEELFVGTILFLAIGASYLAHVFGFSYSLGAFIAGMMIAETKYKHQAEADLVPFRDLLLGIFFITVGMQIDFAIIGQYLHIIVILLICIMLLKLLIIFFILHVNEGKRTSFKTALSLIQVGEFSLALLELARTNGLVGAPHGQVMIVVIVLSMILTPFILKNLSVLSDLFFKESSEVHDATAHLPLLANHTVILGFGEFGRELAHSLKKHDEMYIAIENNIDTYHKAMQKNEPVIFGNAVKKEILKHTNILLAKKIIIAIDNPKKLYHVCQTILSIVDNNKIVVKVHTQQEKKSIEDLGINHIVVENDLACEAVLNLTQKELS